MTEKPAWWPKNPCDRPDDDSDWDDDYYKGWDAASDEIWKAVKKNLDIKEHKQDGVLYWISDFPNSEVIK